MKRILTAVLMIVIGYVLLAVVPVVPVYWAQIVLAGVSAFLLILALVIIFVCGFGLGVASSKDAKGD